MFTSHGPKIGLIVVACALLLACSFPTLAPVAIENNSSTPVATSTPLLTPTITVSPTAYNNVVRPVSNIIIQSTCDRLADAYGFSASTSNQGQLDLITTYKPTCFPKYYYKYGGYFLENGQPLPVMGRTCGSFNVLIVFIDTPDNRKKLEQNELIPTGIKNQIAEGDLQGGLNALLSSYTDEAILKDLEPVHPPLTFKFTLLVTPRSTDQFEHMGIVDGEPRLVLAKEGIAFSKYDAVIWIDGIQNTSMGLRRYPEKRPVFFGHEASFRIIIDPKWLSTGLVSNELLRRNLPEILFEYQYGTPSYEMRDGIKYETTPIINPRTGEDLYPLLAINLGQGNTPLWYYMAGWMDIDHDGITDCLDTEIQATPDNVDADFIPDRFDPDLNSSQTTFFWTYQDKP